MYIQVKTDDEITMDDGRKVRPSATLRYDCAGFKCQIIEDNGAYIVCYENPNGSFSPTPYIGADVFAILKTLPIPR